MFYTKQPVQHLTNDLAPNKSVGSQSNKSIGLLKAPYLHAMYAQSCYQFLAPISRPYVNASLSIRCYAPLLVFPAGIVEFPTGRVNNDG